MLSATTEYALRIAIALTEARDRSLTSDELSTVTKVPVDYAVKVLQWLCRHDFVSAQRGRGGGFRLACDPTTTTLLDIVNAIDPVKRILACPLGREAHRHALCPLHQHLDDLIAQLQRSLGGTTLQDVVDGSRGAASLCEPAQQRSAGRRRAPARVGRRRK
ncbi:MAG: Rrf2 family transcriptional regulator [Planctomycetes bacterium]|nr:Rrf2 family transcriptional regulator [Planctomycetota bacterium]MBI3845489.1 Rrf2 family transcriptional regulator [Planctomycetota bacterium]